jgi:hypothetical protein
VAQKEKNAPRIKINRKLVTTVTAGLVGTAMLAAGISFLLAPPRFSEEDVAVKFKVAGGSTNWSGDKVKAYSSITLKRNFTGEYHVMLDSLTSKTNEWIPISDVTGTGPKFSIIENVELDSTTNKYRLIIRRPGESTPVYTSKIFAVKSKAAYLPTQCPYKELIALAGPDSGMTMDPGQIDGTSLYCTLYPSQGGDYFINMTYSRISKDDWEALKWERDGVPVELGLGESDAYSYSYSDELSGTYDKYIVNYHGVMIDSDWNIQGIKIAIQAIGVK